MPLSSLSKALLQRLAALRLPPVHPLVLALAVSALFVLFYNGQLWSAVLGWWPGRSLHDLAFIASVGLFLAAAFNLVLQPFAFPRVLKPVLVLLILAAAGVSWFASSYGAMMDRSMIANVVETDSREIGDLLSTGFLLHMALFGVFPALAISLVPVRLAGLRREAIYRGATILGSVALVGLIAALFFQDYAVLVRGHREVRFMINPSAAVYASLRYATAVPEGLTAQFTRVADHVDRGVLPASAGGKKTVLVFVVGETARADHFSLNGYARETNPELAKRDVVSFGEVRSCGTSTAESVPCMFSDLARSDYSAAKAGSRENLLDILVRADVDVLWLENNSSCKGVCARVPQETTWELNDTQYCDGGECLDDLLVRQLREAIARDNGRDLVVVMHQIGSHGPSYFKRYTQDYRVFAPTCETNQLQSCTQDEIVNTYDNSIRYTDHFLGDTIDVLAQASDRFNTALLYVSDHGESLGEGGMYLHGMPYMFAPETQKHVPMVFWASPGYRKASALDMACVRGDAGREYSHDTLFHSVLGMFGVRTEVYRTDLDFLAPCRPGAPVAHVAGLPAPDQTAHP
ncbi:phosphoethanolamine--lipid A transferase [Parvibaculum sp.]|uniref:phosphoethanolamine transferase n=1 Tax=Parvibaculum sp. TaxID=2024848 RepID=UPI00329804A3